MYKAGIVQVYDHYKIERDQYSYYHICIDPVLFYIIWTGGKAQTYL